MIHSGMRCGWKWGSGCDSEEIVGLVDAEPMTNGIARVIGDILST